METLFDLSNPRIKRGVDQHVERLSHRTVRDLQALHYLRIGTEYICLDVGVMAVSEDELDSAVLLKLAQAAPLDVLPASPLGLWEKALEGKLLRQRTISCNSTRTHRLVVSLCEAA